MGREWLHWVAGGGRGIRRRLPQKMEENEETSSSAGCMCAVFQLFDLQPHPFSLQPDAHFLQEDDAINTSKGVEAPRNSLELVEPTAMKVASIPLTIKEEENSNFPLGINQIKTRVTTNSKTEDFSSDCSPSTTKTPNLVARLMGLDLLPESNSPSFSNHQTKPNFNHTQKDRNILHNNRSKKCFSDDDITIGACSSATKRSDFAYHRLSLQINKENSNEEFAISAKMRGKRGNSRQGDENRSPGHSYAKQIVKQVKESVMSRKVGLTDITNTNCREKDEIFRRDQNLVIQEHIKKNPRLDFEISPDGRKSKNSSFAPKIKFVDTKKKMVSNSSTKSPRNSFSKWDDNNNQSQGEIMKENKKVGSGNRNLSSGMKKLGTNKANLIVKKKAKKLVSFSSEIVSISGPTLLPVKKDPSPPATKLPQKQSQQVSSSSSSKRRTQLSLNPSRPYNHLPISSAAVSAAPEYKTYIQKILKRAGINDSFTPSKLGKWHTPSHPLDPSIFYYLELFPLNGAVLGRRSNRKLIFQLADELLSQILKPHLDFDPWVDVENRVGLCDELCDKIGGFPNLDCRVLDDIDFLIERDFDKWGLDGEELVCEIEGEIFEGLLCDTVAAVVGGDGGGCTEERGGMW